ncbi:LPS assembly lipoprotein LptE [Methylocapsa polymorpha]|uniref:LPS assembly lipoprotein LptE n=1 Tax=Methylocapsa polymorpha TaxID=3080828 RepID=A0ABZ0HPG8_9HYPH|nr:LPS assembly lipoprotein LptE [Methylocapsa sp. RX1]
MSSSDRIARGWSLAGRLAALLAGLVLAGCFQPLYGPLSADGDIAGELQAIAIDPMPERLGHYLGNELIFALNGTGSKVTPKYRLAINLRENAQTPLFDTVTGYPSAATIIVSADYRLLPAQGGEPIMRGTVTTIASYDRTSQRFANIRAARDAEIRDAKSLADQIRTQIAAGFAGRG